MRIFPLLKDSLDDLRLFVYIKKSSVSSFVLQWGYLWSDDLPKPTPGQLSPMPAEPQPLRCLLPTGSQFSRLTA